MPPKPVAELYIAIGYHKHGKTERYRTLYRHLANSNDKFEIARGAKGMVMTVFTLPSYDMVFKIIKDRFAYPKTSTREQAMDRYRLVFKHDRGAHGGRAGIRVSRPSAATAFPRNCWTNCSPSPPIPSPSPTTP